MRSDLVSIPADGEHIEGVLAVPLDPAGLVLFAHGSGSSRLSPRNGYVAGVLRTHGIGTLLLDLLTPSEDRELARRFDIDLLTRRLVCAARWVSLRSDVATLPRGYFGASTGAAAALRAATADPPVGAVVSRGGRPDLAGVDALTRVEAPTLLLVGGLDHGVIELNEAALRYLGCEKELRIVPGATHLFDEPGTLEQVAEYAAAWFETHLTSDAPA